MMINLIVIHFILLTLVSQCYTRDEPFLTEDEWDFLTTEMQKRMESGDGRQADSPEWTPNTCGDFNQRREKCYSMGYPKTGKDCYNVNGTLKHLCLFPDDPKQIFPSFTLYTKWYPNTPLELSFRDLTTFSNIKKGSRVVFISHGWGSWISLKDTPEYYRMKDALLLTTEYDAVIFVNSSVAMTRSLMHPIQTYFQAMVNTELVGHIVANAIIELHDARAINPSTNIYLIGFSLGCQVMKFASLKVHKYLGKKVARITALDPAAPKTQDFPGTQVMRGDAMFIDVIHTTSGWSYTWADLMDVRIGRSDAIGDVDFFPNGGFHHPTDKSSGHPADGIASKHNYAKHFYVASFIDCPYKSFSCQSINVKVLDGCMDPGKAAPSQMGFHSIKSDGRGYQYLATSPNATHVWC